MRALLLVPFTVAIVLASSGAAKAAEAVARAGGSIIAALAIEKTEDLYFGTVVPSPTVADTVRMTSGGQLNCGSNLTCLGDDATPAGFAVSGEGDFAYTVSLPDRIQLSNGTNTMQVVALEASIGDQGRLSEGGTETFTVGGILSVAAGQPVGDYSGTFSVTVEYN